MSTLTDRLRQHNAVRNVSTVSLHKAAQLVGQVAAVAVIPRLLGAEDHGYFAFFLSWVFLAQILGDLGTPEVMSRFVPALSLAETKLLYGRTLYFKIWVGLLCGLIGFGGALILAPWMRLDWALLISVGTAIHIVAWVPFNLLLGRNQVGLWMVEQAWRQWVLLLLIIPLYPLLGLGGTIWAWTLMEIFFTVLGLWWARAYWEPAAFGLDWDYLWPYLQFGFGFAVANLISALLYRSGPVLVETLTRQTAEAGFMNLAIGLFMMPYLLLTQIAFSFVPTVSDLYARGQLKQVRQWVQNFVSISWLIGWVGVLAVWLLADWGVVFVFGPDYAPAAAPLKWISFSFPPAGLLWGAYLVSMVTGRGRLRLWASVAALGSFLALSFWLVSSLGASGVAIAMTVSVVVNFAALYLFMHRDLSLPWGTLAVSSLIAGGGLWVIIN